MFNTMEKATIDTELCSISTHPAGGPVWESKLYTNFVVECICKYHTPVRLALRLAFLIGDSRDVTASRDEFLPWLLDTSNPQRLKIE